MASSPSTNLLTTLAQASVEFILVGGLAAVAQGAPLTTLDVDIVHRRTTDNLERLVSCLLGIDARYRGRPVGDIVRPASAILSGPGHSLLQTSFGPLDVLGAIEGGRDYDQLLPDSIEIMVGDHRIRTLRLETLIELKKMSNRPKDRLTLLILEATMQDRDRGP